MAHWGVDMLWYPDKFSRDLFQYFVQPFWEGGARQPGRVAHLGVGKLRL